jgi:hypothetical protein
MSVPRFGYEPLAEGCFRLLCLLPSHKQDDHIKYELETYALSSAPPYEALSYTWGNLTRMERISLGHFEYYVTENLYNALYCLRHSQAGFCGPMLFASTRRTCLKRVPKLYEWETYTPTPKESCFILAKQPKQRTIKWITCWE